MTKKQDSPQEIINRLREQNKGIADWQLFIAYYLETEKIKNEEKDSRTGDGGDNL